MPVQSPPKNVFSVSRFLMSRKLRTVAWTPLLTWRSTGSSSPARPKAVISRGRDLRPVCRCLGPFVRGSCVPMVSSFWDVDPQGAEKAAGPLVAVDGLSGLVAEALDGRRERAGFDPVRWRGAAVFLVGLDAHAKGLGLLVDAAGLGSDRLAEGDDARRRGDRRGGDHGPRTEELAGAAADHAGHRASPGRRPQSPAIAPPPPKSPPSIPPPALRLLPRRPRLRLLPRRGLRRGRSGRTAANGPRRPPVAARASPWRPRCRNGWWLGWTWRSKDEGGRRKDTAKDEG